MFGRIKTLGVVVPFAAALVEGIPVQATTAGGGEVEGSVILAPGYFPTSVLASPQNFTFNSILIDGAFASNSPTAECVTDSLPNTTSVTGASTGLLGNPLLSGSLFDAGYVNPFTVAGTCGLAGGGGSIQANLSGSFSRILVFVNVGLTGFCSLNGNGFSCTVHVGALFFSSAPTENPQRSFHLIGDYTLNG